MLAPKSLPKCFQKPINENHQILNRFFLIFNGFWPPSWLPFSTKINKKGAIELKGSPIFSNFAFCYFLEAPPVSIFLDLGTLDSDFLNFSSLLDPILLHFCIDLRLWFCMPRLICRVLPNNSALSALLAEMYELDILNTLI